MAAHGSRATARLAALLAISVSRLLIGGPAAHAAPPQDAADGLKPAATATTADVTPRADTGSDNRPPNVVLIFADDLGYGDLGCYGATHVQTPNIDRLASEGRRFTDAHAVSAVCTPSRFALLTGQYPVRGNGGRGIWGPAWISSPLLIDPDRLTVADLFRERGYRTAAFGKWHLGFKREKNDWQEPLRPGPRDLGFDHYFGVPVVNSAPPYVYVENESVVGNDPADPLRLRPRGSSEPPTPITPLPPEAAQRTPSQFLGAVEAHRTYDDYEVGTTIAERSIAWIEQQPEAPFFLYLAPTNIHHPFTPAPRFQGTSQCGLYGDFIHELDWIVGEVLACLERHDLAENTLVLFTSDNGGMFNRGGQAAFAAGHRQNGELLGFKFGAWEGGHRVPLLVRWPGHIEAGSTSDQLLGHVDVLATCASLLGRELTAAERADSVDMLPAWTGEPAAPLRDHLLLAPHKGTHLSIRQGPWMFIPAQGSGGFGGRRPGEHTFAGPPAVTFVGSVNSDIENGRIKPDAPPAQLYDLHRDPRQERNVIREHPDVVERLRPLLARYAPAPRQPSRGGKPQLRGNPAPRPSPPAPPGITTFDFESGELEPWQIVEGSLGHPIGRRERFFRDLGPYNKQGTYYLTTLEPSPEAVRGRDGQTGVVISPRFVPRGGSMTFRIGGGSGPKTYAALCTDDGRELLSARGIDSQVMQRVTWSLEPYVGQTLHIKLVDRATGPWGHLAVDDFRFDGSIVPASTPAAER